MEIRSSTKYHAWDVVVAAVTTIVISVLEGGHPALWLPAYLNLLTYVAP